MLEYPSIIPDSQFQLSVQEKSLSASHSFHSPRATLTSSTHTTIDTKHCGLVELWIESATTGKSCRQSFDKYETIPSATDQSKRFHFAPLLEELKVHWKLKNPQFIKSIDLELFRNVGDNAEKLWTKRITWQVGKCPESGDTLFNGDLNADPQIRQEKNFQEILTNVSKLEDFPYKCLTVEHSPYMLKLTVAEALAEKKSYMRWLFLDVLVDSIELDWGAETTKKVASASGGSSTTSTASEKGAHLLLSKIRPDIVNDNDHVNYQEKVWGYEKQILLDLQKANDRPDVDSKIHEIKLDSNLFTMADKGTKSKEYNAPFDYNEYKALWGNGPRIPLLAKVNLLKSDDSSTKTDTKAGDDVKVAKALGNSRVLWDWSDNAPPRWEEPLNAGSTTKTRPFLDKAYNQHNRPSLPDNSCNSPADLGGKRGDDTAKIFPQQNDSDPLGFKVEPCQDTGRKWAAFSSFGKDDKQNPTNKTGVIFQPARMAGDTYTVKAYMDFAQKPDTTADIKTVPALQSKAAKFKVLRRVNVEYLVRGTPARLGCTPATLASAAKTFYLKEADIDLQINQQQVDENMYIQALKLAIDEVAVDPVHFGDYDNLELLLRNLINTTNPPADGPAISLYPKKDFLKRVETHFQNSKLRALSANMTLIDGKTKNLAIGKSSGAKGQVLDLSIADPADKDVKGNKDFRCMVLLNPGSPEFRDGETVNFPKTKNHAEQNVTVQANSAKSCWGHTITVEANDDKIHESAVSVVINGTTTLLKYDKSFPSQKLKSDLSSKEKQKLLDALETAAANQNESQQMDIKIRGRIHSAKAKKKIAKGVAEKDISDDNAAERIRKLRELLEEQFNTNAVLDRKKIFDQFTSDNFNIIRWGVVDKQTYKKFCTKDVWTIISAPLIINYATLASPGIEGILFFHIAGRTNAPELEDFKQDNIKDLRTTGGYQPDATMRRNAGVVYLSTLAPQFTDSSPSRTMESVFCHEMGHALFLPHQSSSVPGNINPGGSEYPEVHIAKDNCCMNYDLDSAHFCGMCMIRLRGWKWESMKGTQVAQQYEYKLALELDDVDTLFADPATRRGKMERLQVLGLFNHPLNHPKADDCLAYSLEHAKQLGLLTGTDVAPLKPLISQYLLEGGTLPAPGNFAKMRLPKNTLLYSQGILKTLYPEDFDEYGTDQDKQEKAYSEKFMLGANPFEVDQIYLKDNPALGKIPLKVTVKRRLKGATDWTNAEDATDVPVYFKLIKPDPLPAYAANPNPPATAIAGGNSYYNQKIAPPMNATPQKNFDALAKKGATATDPDVNNAASDVGGKRIGKKASNVFCSTRAEGFEAVAQSSNYTASGDTPHKHDFTARAMTDPSGVARICFNSSMIGGDTYKLRVYVGPPVQEKDDGLPLGDDSKETGTMVRWRTVRISHYVNMPGPANAGELPAELNARATGQCECPTLEAPIEAQTGRICSKCLLRYGSLPALDLKASLTLEMAKAYNELILEPSATAPVAMSTLGNDLLDEVDDLLTTYPRLNALYWARMNPPDIYAETEKFNFTLVKQKGSGDKMFSAVLPYFTGNAKDANGKPYLVPKAGKKLSILSVFQRNTGKPGTEILAETTGDGNLTDLNKVTGGVTADIDYDTGQLVVNFKQPQAGREFYASYFPVNFLDFRSLLYFPNISPFLFNLRMPTDYNQQITRNNSRAMPMDAPPDPPKGRVKPAYHFKYIDGRYAGAVKVLLMMALGRVISNYQNAPSGPYSPGLNIVRALALDPYESIWGTGKQEGKAVGNTIYIFGGKGDVSDKVVNSLALHETSHGLYMVHAPGGGTGKSARPDLHDSESSYTCVMSYADNKGDYCGKCNASMRGMKIAAK